MSGRVVATAMPVVIRDDGVRVAVVSAGLPGRDGLTDTTGGGLRELNVTSVEFGAVGDGVANDTAAFIAAFAAARVFSNAGLGGVIHVPRGVYLWDIKPNNVAQPRLPKFWTLKGAGPTATIIRARAGSYNAADYGDGAGQTRGARMMLCEPHTVVRDLDVDLNRNAVNRTLVQRITTEGLFPIGVDDGSTYGVGSGNVLFERVRVYNAYTQARSTTITSANVTTNVITTLAAHGYTAGTEVQIRDSDAKYTPDGVAVELRGEFIVLTAPTTTTFTLDSEDGLGTVLDITTAGTTGLIVLSEDAAFEGFAIHLSNTVNCTLIDCETFDNDGTGTAASGGYGHRIIRPRSYRNGWQGIVGFNTTDMVVTDFETFLNYRQGGTHEASHGVIFRDGISWGNGVSAVQALGHNTGCAFERIQPWAYNPNWQYPQTITSANVATNVIATANQHLYAVGQSLVFNADGNAQYLSGGSNVPLAGTFVIATVPDASSFTLTGVDITIAGTTGTLVRNPAYAGITYDGSTMFTTSSRIIGNGYRSSGNGSDFLRIVYASINAARTAGIAQGLRVVDPILPPAGMGWPHKRELFVSTSSATNTGPSTPEGIHLPAEARSWSVRDQMTDAGVRTASNNGQRTIGAIYDDVDGRDLPLPPAVAWTTSGAGITVTRYTPVTADNVVSPRPFTVTVTTAGRFTRVPLPRARSVVVKGRYMVPTTNADVYVRLFETDALGASNYARAQRVKTRTTDLGVWRAFELPFTFVDPNSERTLDIYVLLPSGGTGVIHFDSLTVETDDALAVPGFGRSLRDPEVLVEDFRAGQNSTNGTIGALGWQQIANAVVAVADEAGHPGIRSIVTTAVAANLGGIRLTAGNNMLITPGMRFRWIFRHTTAWDADTTLRLGMYTGTVFAATDGAYLERAPGDLFFHFVTMNTSVATRTPFTVAPDLLWHTIDAELIDALTWRVRLDYGVPMLITTNLPAAAGSLAAVIYNGASAAIKTTYLDGAETYTPVVR